MILEKELSDADEEIIFAAEQTEKLDKAKKELNEVKKEISSLNAVIQELRAESREDALFEDAADADKRILTVKLGQQATELSAMKRLLSEANALNDNLDRFIASLRDEARQIIEDARIKEFNLLKEISRLKEIVRSAQFYEKDRILKENKDLKQNIQSLMQEKNKIIQEGRRYNQNGMCVLSGICIVGIASLVTLCK